MEDEPNAEDGTPHEVEPGAAGGVVVVYEHYMSPGHRDRIRDHLRQVFGDREILVLEGGPKIYDRPTDARIDALEQRLLSTEKALERSSAALESIVALLEEEADADTENPQMDLEGHVVGKARDTSRPL